jgi:uncharacterized membrane protein (UPF0127 family)
MSQSPIIIRNLTNPAVDIIQARWCQSFFSRLRGFTFRSSLNKDEGLVLVEARDSRLDTSIHMFFVWTDLAIAWVNSDNEVVDTALARAWRPFYAPSQPARYVIEFHPERHGELRTGDQISFDHV